MNKQFDLGSITPLRYFAGIGILLGLLFGSISADEPGKPVWLAYLQWQIQSLVPMGLLVVSHLVLHKIAWFDRQNPWLKLCASGVCGAVLFAPAALFIDVYLSDETLESSSWWPALLEECLNVLFPVVVAWVTINAPWVLGFKFQKELTSLASVDTKNHKPLDPAQEKSRLPEPAFFSHANSAVQGELIYLKAELHYLKVVTDCGSDLILYNLKDAIDNLAETKGIQCHRSYWVATAHVRSFKKQGRQGLLTMSNGENVPVSRSNISKVTEYLERLSESD